MLLYLIEDLPTLPESIFQRYKIIFQELFLPWRYNVPPFKPSRSVITDAGLGGAPSGVNLLCVVHLQKSMR